MDNIHDVIVIGSGPAGLAAAVAAAEAGARVLLLEQLDSPGRKLLASGGGRCNVTNILSPRDMAASFGRAERFVRHALYSWPPHKLCEFFEMQGVPIEVTDGFHCFPRSGRAKDILTALWSAARNRGAEIIDSCRVDGLLISDGKISGVRCTGRSFGCSKVVIACGGRSYPALGGTGGGYSLAEQAGHRITDTFPAMVGLQCAEPWVHELAGVSLPDAESKIALPGEKFHCRGELLFTHTGISAFAVLDISGRVAELLAEHPVVPLEINLAAGKNREFWMEKFEQWQREFGNQCVQKLLSQELPRRLAAILVSDPMLKAAAFSKNSRRELAGKLSALTLNITGTDGWHKAMVTRGGVPLDEVDSRNLESRLVPGLYFAGEVLDVDGPCGGYNISWALASGFTAGKMAGKPA